MFFFEKGLLWSYIWKFRFRFEKMDFLALFWNIAISLVNIATCIFILLFYLYFTFKFQFIWVSKVILKSQSKAHTVRILLVIFVKYNVTCYGCFTEVTRWVCSSLLSLRFSSLIHSSSQFDWQYCIRGREISTLYPHSAFLIPRCLYSRQYLLLLSLAFPVISCSDEVPL